MKKTIGVELELADVTKGCNLPDGAAWDYDDNTIVNSNGIANDNRGELFLFGGEINTMPTDTVDEQIDHIWDIFKRISPTVSPTINYRCNLHIHIGLKGLKDDLKELKRKFKYFHENSSKIFSIVERLPLPKETIPERYEWERKRLNRIKVSHQYILPQKRYEAVMAATTPLEFLNEHAPQTEKGRMWHFSPRPGINMRQLWETGTIEFRHFPMTTNFLELRSAIIWCLGIVDCPEHLEQFASSYKFKFPKFQPYDFEMEQCYQWTNVAHNSRAEINKRLNELGKHQHLFDLSISPKITYENIIRLCGKHKQVSSGGNNMQQHISFT